MMEMREAISEAVGSFLDPDEVIASLADNGWHVAPLELRPDVGIYNSPRDQMKSMVDRIMQ